jgi:hypothetical protein
LLKKEFETFLRPPHQSELLAFAAQGAVVVFNITPRRNNAFLLTSDARIQVLELPNLKYLNVEDKASSLSRALKDLNPVSYRHVRRGTEIDIGIALAGGSWTSVEFGTRL